ncbi:MAG: uroporphyrinogen decarboxylase family protein [Phycisphaerae bacterium]
MSAWPDYATARQAAGFSWFVGGTQDALCALVGISKQQLYLDPKAGIEAYRRGRPLLREMFGPDVAMPGLSTPGISYGHANGLGSRLIFPEDGEVGHTHPYESLEQGIEALREPVDFASAGMAPFYLDYQRQLQRAFPGEKVALGFGREGPITTAYEMRGEDFFTDIFDDPAGVRRFLQLLTRSILEFHRFRSAANGTAVVGPRAGGMVDDLASMIPARMFRQLVLPYWEQYYRGVTTGQRRAHVEDLRPAQLPFLEEIGLAYYDPSISAKLNPRLISQHCRVPFTWRLGSFHYRGMSARDVQDFVFQSVADGASGVHSYVEQSLCNDEGVRKVWAFISAAKQAKDMLDAGATRQQVGQCVSPEGRARFWDHWWR